MSQDRRPSNQNRPSVTRNTPGGLRFGMFATCVIRDGLPDITGKPKELYTVLVTFSDVQGRDTEKGYPYRTALASALGCSTKTVDRATVALEEIGLVTTHRRKLPGSMENDANRYELHDGWLIHGVEPSRDVPPQLVARYGHVVPGFDIDEFLGGGDTSVATPGDMGVSTGGDMGVAQSRDLVQEPSSRTDVPDGRRPSTGSRGSRGGGSAASGNSKPSFSRQERAQYDTFVAALPAALKALVPKGLPQTLVRAVLDATAADNPAARTVEQLVEYRLMPKWDRYYSDQGQVGRIEKPVGVLVTMLRHDSECQDPRCDERTDVDSGEPCRLCALRGVDRRADRAREAAQDASDGHRPAPARVVIPAQAAPLPGRGLCACGNLYFFSPEINDDRCDECRGNSRQPVGVTVVGDPVRGAAAARSAMKDKSERPRR